MSLGVLLAEDLDQNSLHDSLALQRTHGLLVTDQLLHGGHAGRQGLADLAVGHRLAGGGLLAQVRAHPLHQLDHLVHLVVEGDAGGVLSLSQNLLVQTSVNDLSDQVVVDHPELLVAVALQVLEEERQRPGGDGRRV